MHRWMVLLTLLLVIGCLPSVVLGQQVSVNAQLSTNQVYVGDSVILQITADGAQHATPPKLTTLDGFRVEFIGGQDQSSSFVSIVNGRRTEQNTLRYVMQFRLTPTREGRLTIPSLAVSVNGANYSTSPLSLTAIRPGPDPDFALRVELEKRSVYVGEPIRVKLVWYIGKEPRSPLFSGPDGGDNWDILPAPDRRPPNTRPDDQRFPVVNFLGSQAVSELGQGVLDGLTMTTLTVERIIIPRTHGEFDIGPFTVAFDAVTGRRRRDFFDSPFGDNAITKRVVISSDAPVLSVRPLPESGRPAGFNNLVGNFSIKAETTVKEANVGDPIPLTITITGPEPLNRLAAPQLENQPGFSEAFKPAPEGWETGKDSAPGRRIFTTTIRPRSDKVSEIPSIALHFFDVNKGEYGTARTQAIPLVVRPTRELTSADVLAASPASLAAKALTLTNAAAAIRANDESPLALINERSDPIHTISRPAALLTLGAPPALFLAAALLRASRARSDRPAYRRRMMIRRAEKLARAAGSHAELSRALRTAIGALSGTDPDTITSADCERFLPASVASKAASVLRECDRALFGSPSQGIDSLRSDASVIITEFAATEVIA